MEPVLPAAGDEAAYDRIAWDEAALRPGVDRLLRDLGVHADAQRYASGSLPVYAAGDVVLKLFPPVHGAELPVEAGVLGTVHGRLPIPTPRPVTIGERDGWGYVLMTRIGGVPLVEVWDQIPPPQRDRLATELGEAVAALHALPPPVIDDWWPQDWDAFEGKQRATAVDRQRAKGLADEWLALIPAALDVALDIDLGVDVCGGEPVLLHTEIMREHLLVGPDGDGEWRFRGLIDFEPAMRGHREYEFVALGVYVAEGDRRFLGRLLRAYGHPGDDGFRRRMVAWTLLHYYSNLPRYLRRLPAPDRPDLAALGDLWYGT